MNYVYSTLTGDTAYAVYTPTHDLPILERSILIKGKANIPDRNLVTPVGVVTEVSDSDLAILENDYHFKEHVKNGFITVQKKKQEIEKAVQNMKAKDKSAPVVPGDDILKSSNGGKETYIKTRNQGEVVL